MLKQMLLIGVAAISFPALAQETPPSGDDMAPTEQMPTNPAPDTATPPVDPSTTPTDPTTPPSDPTTPPAGEATTEPGAATPDQVAQIVNQEFPTYDADASQELNENEFATWMKKLRTATDPTVDPESEQVKSWIGQAFAAADADKSGGVTKEELTGFLSRGA